MKAGEFEKKTAFERKRRVSQAYKPVAASFAVNLVLFLMKLTVGVLSGSVAIIADAWHTVSDSLTTVFVFFGFKITEKKPDESHPYGHERAEKIVAVIIGVILFGIAGNFLVSSIRRLIDRQAAFFGTAALGVLAFSVFAKEILARYSISTGRRIDADSLVGDGWHHRSDAISSAVILAGIIIGRRWWWMDANLGILIAFMLFKASYEIVKKSSSTIMGESLSGEKRDKLKRLAREVLPESGDAHHFHLHSYGSHKELSFHISLPGDISLEEAHSSATRLEEAVRRETGFEPTIHVDPGDYLKEKKTVQS